MRNLKAIICSCLIDENGLSAPRDELSIGEFKLINRLTYIKSGLLFLAIQVLLSI